MNVPLLDLKAQYATIRDEIDAAVQRVMESQHFILGPEVEACEQEIASYLGVPHAVGVSSGSDGLLIALMAEQVKAGDEVITTPFTFFATVGAIVRLGATPVFVDIDPQTFNIDTAAVSSRVTGRTRVIMPVHLYGQMADMQPIEGLARANGIAVIEDAAQAFGAAHDGRHAGTVGDIGSFSFFPAKNLGAAGDGGIVVTRDQARYDALRRLRVHGASPKYYHQVVGGNFRLDALQAAIVRVKLRHLDSWCDARREHAAYYSAQLRETGVVDAGHVTLPAIATQHHVFNQYVMRARRRDALQEYLRGHDIATAVYYPRPMHLQECFAFLGHREGDFPESERAAHESLAVPVSPETSLEQIDFVVSRIAAFYS